MRASAACRQPVDRREVLNDPTHFCYGVSRRCVMLLTIPKISLLQLLNQRSRVVQDSRDDEHSLVPSLAVHR